MSTRLSILNDPPQFLEGPRLLHQLIRWERVPSACALDFTSHEKRQKYSYQELHACVASVAACIQRALQPSPDLTSRPQHVVPILLPQSPSLYISQLAILESGGAFCPINLDAPKERIKFVVSDVGAGIIITTPEFKDVATWENGPMVILVDEFPVVPTEATVSSSPSREAQPHELAYVMYTSGSSGLPKGVAVSHLAASQSLLAHERHIPPFKRFLQFAAPSFDVSVFEIFFPFTRACTLVGCNRSQLLNDLPGMITELEIDAAELTPTVVGSLLQKRSNAPGLKLLLTIGEMLTRPIVEEFGGSDEKPNMLYGMYGPTEAAIHCTIYPAMEASAKPGNIGIPLDTVSTFVVAAATTAGNAANLTFLPLGELGELVLGGPQLASGYLNRPDQNKAAFVEFEGKNYYRTGDKARQLENGTIEILGRMSAGQVKLRGQRIELGEIEEVVYKHPGIKTVSAVVLSGVLIVFALIGEQDIHVEDVMKTCAKWLPKFMVPSEIVLLQNFSYLPSGKVDKRKLEADYRKQREAQDDGSSASETVTEKTVRTVVQEILGPFPKNTRLAALGLDSLVAIRVASKLRSSGFNITTVAVLQADTLDSLTKICEDSKSAPSQSLVETSVVLSEDVTTALNGHAKDVEAIISCTPLQSAMLSETAINPKAYRNWVELELPGLEDLGDVYVALRSLSDMNPILRTGFSESEDTNGYIQIVWRSLIDSQIEEVARFEYEFDDVKDTSLNHPLRIQIMQSGSTAKLLIHLHHALYDAWSLELLLDDLDLLLQDQSPPSRPSFSNVIGGYQDGTLLGDSWSSKDYWKDHLLSLDPRPVPTFHSSKAPCTGLAIVRHLTTLRTLDIEAAARRLSSSPQSLFQAAYALVLSSYLGSHDVCFGTVFSGRTLPIVGVEDIVGPCLATLPIRVDISASSDLQSLVQELNSINRKHLEHSTLPLREIKAAGGVHPRQPLFDTLLIWQQTLQSYDHTRKHVSLVDTVDNLEFNLTLEIIPGVGNIELKANYERSLFPQSQIVMLLRQVEELVKVVLRPETTPLAEAPKFLDITLLSTENIKPEVKLRSGRLASPVEIIAAEDPRRPAIDFALSISPESSQIQRMTYGELNAYANQIGHHLLAQDAFHEVVCICMEKCVDFYASILATAKVGGGYLPVTPDVPQDRLQYILHEASVKVVIARSESRSLFQNLHNIMVIYIDEVDLERLSPVDVTPRFSEANLAYCVFTSGSTGTPKGVMVTQGNLLSNLDVLEDLYPASQNSRFLQSCSQAFDVSVFEIFFAWRVGGCLCSAVKDVLFRDIEQAIRELQVSHLSLTPTVAALIEPKNVPLVEFLVTAGEAVTQKVFNTWAGRGLWQGYGPSETTNICTIKPNVSPEDSINNIGPPLKNTSVFVLSPGHDFSLVPRGGEGEFCFGGSQVFRGYMDPKQNVGKIIDHAEFGRLYRSGDFGRLMPDGSLAFTGRKDDQVKVRGQRVELGEITNVMLRSDHVQDCTTMVIGGKDGRPERLVCFWTSVSVNSADVECLSPDSTVLKALYDNLDSALPPYMIPSMLIPVSCLPSTPQGKIDRRLLIAQYNTLSVEYLDSTTRANQTSIDHQWTDFESDVAETLAQVTNVSVDQITPSTSFFNLGIDSVSAISFARSLRQRTQRNVEISDILKHPSVIRLAERMSASSQSSLSTDLASSSQVFDFGFDQDFASKTMQSFAQAGRAVQKILPCTPLQEAMLSTAESSSLKLYNNLVVLDIVGNIEKMKECWSEMTRRHEILRTCFIRTDEPQFPYAQVILEEFPLKISSIECSADETQKLVEEYNERLLPQNEFEPPYSLELLHSPQISKLLISMHHALYDGAALEVLYEEVERLYHHKTLLPSVSFEPFLRSMVSMDAVKADQFWEEALSGCSSTLLQSAHEPTTEESRQGGTRLQRTHSRSSLAWIEEQAKKHGTSLLAACHAVWASIISESVQKTDICFGNVVSGRTASIEGVERLVAPCFNTIPARLQNIHKLSYLEAFRKLQTLNASSIPFQLTPLRRIQSKFSADGTRLYDTLFILQQPPRVLDSSIWSIAEDDGAMDLPFVCEVVPHPRANALEIILHTHCSKISAADAHHILNAFDTKLQEALKNPRRQLLSTTIKEQIILVEASRATTESNVSKITETSKEMNAEEKEIQDVISKFTSVPLENIRRETSLFRLGLDSISTVQVAARLRKQGHKVLASDVLENPTIAQLCALIAQNRGDDASAEIPQYDFQSFDKKYRDIVCSKYNLNHNNIEAVRPCTAVQKGMIAQSLHSDGQEYVNSVLFELQPNESLSKLKEAWGSVQKEHEMLRTGFAAIEDSSNPFTMVTYGKATSHLPWFEGTAKEELSFADQLLQGPWSIKVFNDNDKTFLRLTAHHALYDAQSMSLILSDVADAYESKTILQRPPVTNLLGAILQSGHQDEDLKRDFWQSEGNKIIVNRFPDLTPLRVSTETSSVREVISTASTEKLEEWCMRNGVTMQAAGQAAWARLLYFYIGESGTTFGMTLSGRSIAEDSDKISFPSIVTLPIRCDVVGTNADLLSRSMNTNALLHKHQFTPLTSIQKWGGFPEGKIFDTLFAYQKTSLEESNATLPWKVVQEEATVDYAVSLEVQTAESGEIALRLTFKDSLIPAEQAELLLKQYDALLQDIVLNPQSQSDVAPEIGATLLSITPAKEPEIADTINLLHEYVERGAIQWPEKVALEFATCLEPRNMKSTTWTYQELNCAANKVAHMLLEQSILPGQLIAICFDKCAEASISIIGILKAGCAYVALDPNAPAERMKFIIEDSGAKLILTAGKPGQMITDTLDKQTILLDNQNSLEGFSADSPKLTRPITPEDTSYCLYTSGTTGTPKGCILSHSNAVQAMLAFHRIFSPHWTTASKWLQFASFHFDVSVLEQFWSWSVGICVVSAPRDLIFEDIPHAIRSLGVTHIDLTPSLARLLHPDDVPGLTKGVFITGGEQLKQEILDVWGEHACIYNGYGPTEATIGVTMYPRVPKNGKPSNIGPAFDNVGSFVLKPNTALPVLRGGVGELCVSGMLVGKGYLNRPDLTTERFPTLEGFNERVYRTGDLVRILHDGTFTFLGRADDQVKLRGQRLELGEINEVIKKSRSDMEEVVTLVLKHSTQQKEQLVTFLVLTNPIESPTDDGSLIAIVRNACKSRLPGYMVPTHFIPIKAMPLSANNKADAKQLAAMYNELTVDDLQRLSRSSEKDKPWTTAETNVLETIAAALQVDTSALTRGTSIFELGMDSISIIGFSRTLINAGYQNAKLSVIRSNTSISGLVQNLLSDKVGNTEKEAAYISASQEIALFSQKHMVSICNELGVDSTKVQKIAPCTPVQGGMIYRFLEHDEALYFNRFEFSLDNEINIENMFKAWDRVISQLEILRTKFVPTDDGYAQVVLQTVEAIRQDDASFSYDRFEKSEALKTPWAYAIGSGLMVLQIFHGLYDGNSLVMILQRLATEYTKLEAASETSQFSYGPSFHDTLPYGPLAKMPGAKDFWTNHLSNWYPQEITNLSMRATTVEVDDILPNFEEFETLRKILGVSHQALVQAAWMFVLQAQISPKLTATGIVTSGRTIDFEGADDVIGPLFNTIPFILNIAPDMTWKKIISECHKFGLQMQDFQHTPLKDIQKWSPSGPGQPLFEALFVFQRPDSTEVDFAKALWSEKPVAATADYPLAFEATANAVADGGSSLALKLVSNASVLSTDQAIETLKHIKLALNAMLKNQGETGVFDHLDISPAISGHLAAYQSELTQNGSRSSDFQWTREAELFRKEIASLANVAKADIHGDSSLFELGLDSIDVIKLSSRLRRHGVNIAVSTIIRSQTIQKMASAASIAGSQEPVTSSEGFVKKTSRQLAQYLKEQGTISQNIPNDSVLPATPLQEGMVHLMTQSDYEMYFNVEIFKLDQNTDPKDLIAAVKKVVDASPVLSTYFLKIEDTRIPANYAQIIREGTALQAFDSSFEEWDQSEISQQSLNTLRAAAISRASKSQELFQVQYLTVGSNKYMVISIAHALYDGSSIQIFHNDIKRAYLGEQIQRIDFRPCLEEIFKSTTADATKFWRSTLSNLPPAKFPRNAVPDTEQVHRATRQSTVAFSEIQNFCKESSVFIHTLGQTCWALVLAQLMGQLDVVFGTVLSCRDFPNADQVMFPLMNTVAVRSVLHGTLDEMLKYMQEMGNTTRQYQHFPLGEAQSIALSSRGKANDNTFFDTLFIYQGRHAAAAGQSLYESEFSHADVDFPICVELEISEEGKLSWTTACKSSVRNKDETDQILTALDSVLQYVINSRTAPTFVAEADGVSICGLPKFQKRDTDSKALPERPLKPIHSEWTGDELIIRKAFQEVSGVPEDSIHKDTTIFELGLDSISVHKLRKLLDTRGIKLSVSEILRSLNIDAMIKSLASAKSDNFRGLDVDAVLFKVMSSTDLTVALKDLSQFGEIRGTMPATAGQLYLLRGWEASHGAVFYPTFYYQLSSGAFDKERLEEAWKVLLGRHAILRTGFVESGSNIFQVIFKEAHSNVTYGESKTDRLPLSGEPPVTLVVDENMSRLGLKIHHALYDAVSIEILLHELESLYQGQSLSPQDGSEDFRTFVAHSTSPSSQALREKKWRSYLGCKDTLLPPSAQQSSTLGRTELFQPNLNVAGIKDFAKTKGITTDALFLTVMAQIFARRARSEIGVVFGIYLANRNSFDQLDFTTMAAPTLNLLPVHVGDALRSTSDAKKVATSIQEDLSQISSAEMSSASLQEIYEWTGVRVNCFVNILKDMGDAEKLLRRDGVQYFEPAPQPAIEDETRSSPALNLENVHVSEAYLESLDVEIKLQDNGQLDMGVFGPKSLVSTEEAEKMIEDFRSSLIKIIES